MRRANDLLGLPVTDTSTPLGVVREVLIDFARGNLGALLLEGSMTKSGLIPMGDVDLGREIVWAPVSAIRRGGRAAIFRQGKLTLEQVRRLTVVASSGSQLGKVADLVLKGPELVALELSAGLIQDVFKGRDVLPWPLDTDLGRERLVTLQ